MNTTLICAALIFASLLLRILSISAKISAAKSFQSRPSAKISVAKFFENYFFQNSIPNNFLQQAFLGKTGEERFGQGIKSGHLQIIDKQSLSTIMKQLSVCPTFFSANHVSGLMMSFFILVHPEKFVSQKFQYQTTAKISDEKKMILASIRENKSRKN